MNLNQQTIQTDLQKLAGDTPVKVKISKHLEVATSIRETDAGFTITLNPAKIRSPKKLESHLSWCREAIRNYNT